MVAIIWDLKILNQVNDLRYLETSNGKPSDVKLKV